MIKSKNLSIVVLLVCFGLVIHSPINANATLPLAHNTDLQWEINTNDTLIYSIVDNFGTRYEAYNITGEPWISSGFLDVLNVTMLEFNQTTESVENSDTVFQCAVSLDSGVEYWQLSFYEGGSGTGGLTMAFPLIPVNSSGLLNQTQLNDWGGAMTHNLGGTTYPSLGLLEYTVVSDNELHLYNSTNGYYVNLTYNSVGILESASVKVGMNMGGFVLLEQTITRITGNVNTILNPLDETSIAVTTGDSLIYQISRNGATQGYQSYNITYVGEIMGDYQGSTKSYWGANATKYDYDTDSASWVIDNQWIDQTIGGGDDNYLFLRMDGPSNIIHPVGTNGTILDMNLANIYSTVHGGYLDTHETGVWWAKFSNTTTGQYIRIELQPNTGILLNLTYTQGTDVYSQVLINEADLPSPPTTSIPTSTATTIPTTTSTATPASTTSTSNTDTSSTSSASSSVIDTTTPSFTETSLLLSIITLMIIYRRRKNT